MAWKDGFVIEYGSNDPKHTSCRDCIHADLTEKCCNKRPIVFREDGYGYWKSCNLFVIRSSASSQKKKEAKLIKSKLMPTIDDFFNIEVFEDEPLTSLFDFDIVDKQNAKANAPKAYIKPKHKRPPNDDQTESI
ncbi:hypothetical protein [Butyrivibrio fibrisolvens]|uniref:hypothetical protein n=1 Tax=Butyrivibrio fibrisolvens TaxID=831 RepID=UPI0003B463B7|nr:hypothetical protein [Butyrivibrio fibrisolvens]